MDAFSDEPVPLGGGTGLCYNRGSNDEGADGMDQKQRLELAQVLKLSPTLLQSMGILQMTTLELADYLKDLALENPVMEEAPPGEETLSWDAFASQVPWLAEGGARPAGAPQGEPGGVDREPDDPTFFLEEQLDRLKLEGPLDALCRYLIGLLDHRGRLDPEDLADLTRAGVPEDLLERGIALLQSLEPAGVGARSTGECLALQLQRRPGDHAVALAICREGLDLLAREQYGALARKLGVSQKEIQAAARTIRTLDPNPVGDLSPQEPVGYLRPDAWVAEIDGQLRVFVNQWDLPRFALSRDYLALAQGEPSEETAEYLREKIRQARWVLQCVHRRQETLERCLTALVIAQEDFFRGKTVSPAPLLGRDLAETLGVHPSTVSRTLGHKVLQCQQGAFPVRWFFGRAVGRGLSARGAQARIAQLVKEEDPRCPYSDQALADLLAGEGLPLARRTVAKYRQVLGLPPAWRRRR